MTVLSWEDRTSIPELIAHLVNLIEKYTELYEKIVYIEECVSDMVENAVCGACANPESPPESPVLYRQSTTHPKDFSSPR